MDITAVMTSFIMLRKNKWAVEQIDKYQFAGMLTKDMETEKHGNHGTAYYAPESGRYFARIMYISREGLEE